LPVLQLIQPVVQAARADELRMRSLLTQLAGLEYENAIDVLDGG